MSKASGSITMMDENETLHVLLSSESVSITCDKDGGTPVMSGTSAVVFASQGVNAVAFTISSITGVGCNGLITGGTTVSIVNDATLVANNSGYIDINISVSGQMFTKRFGFSKSKTGATGGTGGTGGTGAVGTSYRAKGAWANAIAYVNNATYIDIITSNGSTFYCKVSHTSLNGTNNPSAAVPPIDNTWWGVSAMQGVQGPIGAGYTNKGAWLIGTAYTKTTSNIDTVNCEGSLYACVVSATGQNPIGNPTYWTLLVSKGSDGTNTMKRGTELVWTKVNVTMNTDGGFYKVSPGVAATWDSQAYTADKYTGGAILTFENFLVNHSTMVGLTTTPTTNASYTAIGYAWYINGATYDIYESGTSKAITGVVAVGDVFTITYDGEYIRYYMNSVLKRSVAIVILLPLYIDSSFSVLGTSSLAQIGNIHFGGYSDKSPTLDWISAWTGQSTLVKDTSIVSPKIFAGINGGTSASPSLTGVAIGRDVLGGTNANIGLVVYNANIPIVRINANGSASFGRTVADGGIAGQQFLVNANGSITTPTILATTIIGGTLTLGGAANVNGYFALRNAANTANIVSMDNTGILIDGGNYKIIDSLITCNALPLANLIVNPSFEGVTAGLIDDTYQDCDVTYMDGWQPGYNANPTKVLGVFSNASIEVERAYVYTGNRAVTCNNATAVSQWVMMGAGRQLTLSFYARRNDRRSPTGVGNAKVNINKMSTMNSWAPSAPEYTSSFVVTNTWKRYVYTFTTTDMVDGLASLGITLTSSDASWIIFDCVQLVFGALPAIYQDQPSEIYQSSIDGYRMRGDVGEWGNVNRVIAMDDIFVGTDIKVMGAAGIDGALVVGAESHFSDTQGFFDPWINKPCSAKFSGAVGIGGELYINSTLGITAQKYLIDGVSSSGMQQGTGDGGGYNSYNLMIKSWWGIGFYDSCNSDCKIVIDTRSGGISMRGEINGFAGIGTTAKNISNVDLNGVVTAGFYVGSSMGNAAITDWCYLHVQGFDANAYCSQTLCHLFGNSMWHRVKTNGTWQGWRSF